MSIESTFDSGRGLVTTLGDTGDNDVIVNQNAAGTLFVNDEAVFRGGIANVTNTRLIQVFGEGGNDNLVLNEANGALPAVSERASTAVAAAAAMSLDFMGFPPMGNGDSPSDGGKFVTSALYRR